jgi:ABC-2 type transport system ATP-binding protein
MGKVGSSQFTTLDEPRLAADPRLAPPPGSAQMSPTGEAIYTEALVRHFDGLPVVDEVDLRIPRGEIYGFLGPNGAGKSTTVRMLCTLLAPTGGRALVAGYDVATQPGQVRLRIGVALQEAALDPKQTGSELLRLQGRLYGLSKRALVRRLAEMPRRRWPRQ